jgi:hypothetical protein
MRLSAAIVIIASSVVLAGCVSPASERGKAIEFARKRCESQGKQLLVEDLKQDGVPNFTDYHTTVAYHCVGPDDPGSQASSSAAK